MTSHYILYFVFYFKIDEPLNTALICLIFAHFRHHEQKKSLNKYCSIDRFKTNDFVTRAHKASFRLSLRPGHFFTISTSS